MHIAVRIDDITPDMDWDSFLRFKQLLDSLQIKPLIGVVPDNQDPNLKTGICREDFWDFLLQLKLEGWSIAQHGFRHLYSTEKGGIFPLNHFSEFAGLPHQEQLDMLRNGRDILRSNGLDTDIFMAPAHSYDKNTLRALKELGFSYITDGFSNKPYCRQGLVFTPIAFRRDAVSVKKATAGNTGQVTTLVYHLNHMKEEEFRRYESELNTLGPVTPYSEILKLPVQPYNALTGIREKMLAVTKHYLISLRGKTEK